MQRLVHRLVHSRPVMRWLAASLVAALPLWTTSSPAQTPAPAERAATAFWEVSWLELVPPDWKPQERIDLKRANSLSDEDTLAKELMLELREILDTAPTVPALDGQRIRMPGYVVPLENGPQGLSEFLLVPYFGACIHTPPPAANQIVHVKTRTPVTGFGSLSAVWVSGTMQASRRSTTMGVSGYTLELAHIAVYSPN